MDTHEAASKIRALMNDHGLTDWRLGWLRTKRTLGVCRYGTMEIGINHEYVTLVEWDEIEQVALHEIAHALAGPLAKHGIEWHRVALSIGVKDPASRTEGVALPGRYRAVCDTCGTVHYRYKRAKRMNQTSCGKCCKRYAGGRYDQRFALTYVDTYATRRMIVPEQAPTPERTEDMSETATLSAPQLAAQIGTDPKTLRRFLRENDSFRNPGSGKRYTFTAREAASVEKAFRAWDGTRTRRQTTGETRPKNKSERTAAERKNAARTRIDALEKSLRSTGKHISQHR